MNNLKNTLFNCHQLVIDIRPSNFNTIYNIIIITLCIYKSIIIRIMHLNNNAVGILP